jgi:hypothetical protein
MRTVMVSPLLRMVPGLSRKRRWWVSGFCVGVAGAQSCPEGGEQGLGQDAEHHVEVDVEVDGGGKGVGTECLGDLGEALFDSHAAGGWRR